MSKLGKSVGTNYIFKPKLYKKVLKMSLFIIRRTIDQEGYC